ncbi:MAG: hypothetical protein IMX00_10155 [Limnochordales bacterium]|nr:hypothetical protein [Limnochordales bacterium]
MRSYRSYLRLSGLPFFVASLMILGAVQICDAATASGGQPAGGSGKRTVIVQVRANPDEQTVRVDQKTGITTIETRSGIIEIVYGDIKATATRLEYNQKQQTAVLSGNLQVIEGNRTIIAERVEIDFRADQYTFIGKVQMVEKDESGNDGATARVKLSISADRLVYNSQTGEAVAEGNVRAAEGDRKSQADKLVYKSNWLQLTGKVQVTTDDGMSVSAARMEVDMDRNTVQIYGQTSMSLVLEDE